MSKDDVLDQDEIDALLTGVAQGDIQEEDPKQYQGAMPFDFAAQDRIVRGRMPALEMANERFAREVRADLFNFFRQPVDMTVLGVKIVKCSEYMGSMLIPTSLNLVKIPPLKGTSLFVIDAKLVYLFVENYFGGDGRFGAKIEGRDFTSAECRIVRKVLDIMFSSLKDAWKMLVDVNFEYQSSELNPAMANIASPAEMLVVCDFSLELEGGGGHFNIVLPYTMIEPIRESFDNAVQSDQDDGDDRWERALKEEILDAKVKINSILTEIKTDLNKISQLKEGDILPIELPKEVTLLTEGVPMFHARYGVSGEHLALKINSVIDKPTEYKLL